jgi:hypothetical protein
VLQGKLIAGIVELQIMIIYSEKSPSVIGSSKAAHPCKTSGEVTPRQMAKSFARLL